MIELYIENQRIDTQEDFSVDFTYETIDPDKLASVKNSFSKTVKLPGTPKNNSIFGHIYNVDWYAPINPGSNIYGNYDPHKRVNWQLNDNGVYINRGYCTLDSVDISDQYKITYNLTLYGGLGEFFYNLSYNNDGSEKHLEDLYFHWAPKLSFNGTSNPYSQEDETPEALVYVMDPQTVGYNMTRLTESNSANASGDPLATRIEKDVTLAPIYTGYYDNFDSSHMLISVFNELYVPADPDMNSTNKSNFTKAFPATIADGDDTYTTRDSSLSSGAYSYGLATFSRDLEPSEACDLRMSELPAAIRLSKLMSIITDVNTTGYDVEIDEEITNSYYWQYGWILLGKIKADFDAATAYDLTHSSTYDSQTITVAGSGTNYSFTGSGAADFTMISSQTCAPGKYNAQIAVTPAFTFECSESVFNDYWIGGGNFIPYYPGTGPDYSQWIGKQSVTPFGNEYYYYIPGGNAPGPQGNVSWPTKLYVLNMRPTMILDINISGTHYYYAHVFSANASYSDNNVLLNALKTYLNSNNVSISMYSTTPKLYSYELISGSNYRYVVKGDEIKCATNFQIDTEQTITITVKKAMLLYKKSNNITEQATVIKTGTFNRELNGANRAAFYFNKNVAISTTGAFGLEINDNNSQLGLQEYAGYSNIKLTKKTLFAEAQTPFKYFVDFCKMMNLKFICDNVNKKIKVLTYWNYYTDDDIRSLDDKIDYSRKITLKPLATSYKTLNIGLSTPATYGTYIYDKTSKNKFNERKYDTGIEWNSTEQKILNELSYKNTIDWQTSSIFNRIYPQIPKPYNNINISWTLWKLDENNELQSKEFFTPGQQITSNQLSVKDSFPKLCGFDQNLNSTSIFPTFVFLNGYVKNYDYVQTITGDNPKWTICPRMILTTDTVEQFYLNGNRCYVYDFKYNDSFAGWGSYSTDQKGSAAPFVLPFFSRDLYNLYDSENSKWTLQDSKVASWNISSSLDSTSNNILDNVYSDVTLVKNNKFIFTKKVTSLDSVNGNEYTVNNIPSDSDNTRIFDLCWKGWLDNIYSPNTRDYTLYADVSGFADPNDMMRRIYSWHGRPCIITKVENYRTQNITRDKFTKITLHVLESAADLIRSNSSQPTPPTPSHNYPGTFTLVTGGSTRACYNATIPVGKKIGFDDSSYYSSYKYAINLSSPGWPDVSNWDTSYTGAAYLQQDVTITTQSYQIMIALADGGSPTSSDLAIINAHFYVDD